MVYAPLASPAALQAWNRRSSLASLSAFIVLRFASIIGIPAGVACFRIAHYTLWPFGRTIVDKPGAGVGSGINNVIWIVLFGWELALVTLLTGLILCLTIVGIPLGMACFKLVPVTLVPFGKTIVKTG